MFTKSLLLATILATALAIPTPDVSIIHEKRSNAHASKASRIKRNAIIPIRIALEQSNLDTAYSYLMDVSHPSSANYGKHWTSEQVDTMFAPSSQSVETVRDWLIANGINGDTITMTRSGGWLKVDMPAYQAESLFNTEYHEYVDADGSIRIGCDEYHLPKHVSAHVDFVRPAVALSPPMTKSIVKRSNFVQVKSHQQRSYHWRPNGPSSASPAFSNATVSNCGTSITPDCIKALYGIPDATIGAEQDPANALGLYESGDVYAQEDLDAFFAKYATYVPQGTAPTLQSIDGATAPVAVDDSLNTGESDIDMDMAYSLIYPQQIVLYQASTSFPNNDGEYVFIDSLLDAVDGSFCNDAEQSSLQCGAYDLTRVISISYDSPELADSSSNAQRACNEIMKLSLQGHTIVVSSGDYGVASHPQGETNGCADSSGNSAATDGDVFQPQFPATCPYVLAVGATMLTSDQTVSGPESVMTPPQSLGLAVGVGATFTSGGGFSNYFSTPDYQSSVLSSYFSNSDPGYSSYTDGDFGSGSGVYNRNGRGIPDVSANGAFFSNFNQGNEILTFGTSLAAPLWGSIITLINEERSANGKGPVGFINPTLYEHPEVFTDITIGSNPGCNTNGFPAVAGWDPATGLGTPIYQSLLQLMMSLP